MYLRWLGWAPCSWQLPAWRTSCTLPPRCPLLSSNWQTSHQPGPCPSCVQLESALASIEGLGSTVPAAHAQLALLVHLSTAAHALLFLKAGSPEQRQEDMRSLLAGLVQLSSLPRHDSSLAEYQRHHGFARCLDAQQLCCLRLMLQRDCLGQLTSAAHAAPALLQQLEAVSRQLCREQPDSPDNAYQLATALLLRGNTEAALAMQRVVMRLAHTKKGERVSHEGRVSREGQMLDMRAAKDQRSWFHS